MRFNRTLLSVLCAVVLVSPCYAERRQDDASNPTRDDSIWSMPLQSRTNLSSEIPNVAFPRKRARFVSTARKVRVATLHTSRLG